MTSAPLLEVQGLHTAYGSAQVLQGIDLTVHAGEVIGLLGRNGMGKTTLVNALMGIVASQAGSVRLAGESILGRPAHAIARRGLALVPEGRQLFASLTVEEHLTAFMRPDAQGVFTWTVARAFELFPRLGERRAHMGHQLSGGEQQMLAIARALVTHPRLLILDEATEGLGPLVREEIWHVLAQLRQAGQAIIVIDKYVQRLIRLADRQVILERGRVAWSGTSEALDAQRELWPRYLGV